jgi:hypothetical protein
MVAAVCVLLAAVGCTSDTESVSASYLIDGCTPESFDGWSAARIWDEAMLDAIRRDTPAPTVHSRNLFHTSAAMWDAWAAYDSTAEGYFVDEKVTAGSAEEIEAARHAAISFAAYRVLLHRYSMAVGLESTFDQLASTMERLCYRVDYTTTDADTPAALGNRIAATVIEDSRDDGSLEGQRYADPRYQPANDPMIVAEPGATMRDPSRWQPLALSRQIAQNGVPIAGSVQRFIGPQWGHVESFAMPSSPEGLPIDPGPPPMYGEESYGAAALEVVEAGSFLGVDDGVTMDISPGAFGDNPLGTNDGDGHELNPETGEPYEPNVVLRGDFARVLAEFWADGPDSETPPGHWNTIANAVSDAPGFEFRIGGDGPEVDRLEWDVKLYFALNGAVHDAAVAAWGVKRFYDSVRPISMIRYLGERGELPLVPGVVEVVTAASSAPGQRHAELADRVGEVVVRSWLDYPDDPTTETVGVGWLPAVEWIPYQRPSFVTPAFAGYISGHSTFSRAAAEVMTGFTGSEYFPGGLSEWTVEAGSLIHEDGPSRDVTLQWATYYDAADQAGISRIFGGIHITADDYAGRRTGSQCGTAAWDLAQRYFAGTIGS